MNLKGLLERAKDEFGGECRVSDQGKLAQRQRSISEAYSRSGAEQSLQRSFLRIFWRKKKQLRIYI